MAKQLQSQKDKLAADYDKKLKALAQKPPQSQHWQQQGGGANSWKKQKGQYSGGGHKSGNWRGKRKGHP